MNVTIFAETAGGKIASTAYELLTRALELTDRSKITALVISDPIPEEELIRLTRAGAGRVVIYKSVRFAFPSVESFAHALTDFVKRFAPDVLLGSATTTGRTLLPYVAMKLRTGLTADCTRLAVEEETGLLLQTRPAIGGNILATIKTPNHKPQMATVRPHSVPPAPIDETVSPGEIFRLMPEDAWFTEGPERIASEPLAKEIDLANAKRIVVVGRGIKRPENLGLVRELATALNASIGATREVVDRGWLPYACQIGLSGRTVTPELYVGLGVSGAIQHLAGMRTARRIVAVNSDPEAGIFHVADLGVVGNLFDVLPRLLTELRKGKTL